MINCPTKLVDGKWTCPNCGWVYPLQSERPPHRNCPKASSAKLPKPGVGDFLHDILLEEFNLDITASCGCKKQIQLMNAWGSEGCQENIGQIVNHMLGEAKKRDWRIEGRPLLSIAAKLGTKTTYGMIYARKWARNLVRESIKQFERQNGPS